MPPGRCWFGRLTLPAMCRRLPWPVIRRTLRLITRPPPRVAWLWWPTPGRRLPMVSPPAARSRSVAWRWVRAGNTASTAAPIGPQVQVMASRCLLVAMRPVQSWCARPMWRAICKPRAGLPTVARLWWTPPRRLRPSSAGLPRTLVRLATASPRWPSSPSTPVAAPTTGGTQWPARGRPPLAVMPAYPLPPAPTTSVMYASK